MTETDQVLALISDLNYARIEIGVLESDKDKLKDSVEFLQVTNRALCEDVKKLTYENASLRLLYDGLKCCANCDYRTLHSTCGVEGAGYAPLRPTHCCSQWKRKGHG
jgi:hypothetical protein